MDADQAAAMQAAWDELVLDALASDGPIRDSDVRDAVRRNRERIEKTAAAIERGYMKSMRHDYQTMPHGEFQKKWPGWWREYGEVLPLRCDCRDCALWRSGS